MPNYQNSKIYKLVCSETNKIYIGSTTQKLCQRLGQHKISYNRCMSKTFINPKIFLIENCPCDSKEELLKKEREFIESIECINMCKPYRSKEEEIEYKKMWHKKDRENDKEKYKERYQEYYQKNKDKIKNNREKNKDKLKKVYQEYYQKNKDKIKNKSVEYRKQNKEEINIKKKAYREANKEKLSLKHKDYYQKNKEKITCDCGLELTKQHLKRHYKTKKHQEYLDSI